MHFEKYKINRRDIFLIFSFNIRKRAPIIIMIQVPCCTFICTSYEISH